MTDRSETRVALPVGDDLEQGLSSDEFKEAFRNYPAGVALITADDGRTRAAMTATSVTSLSADPPLLMFSLSEFSSATPVVRAANSVVVHFLGAAQIDLAKLGATSGIDRFANSAEWTQLPSGEPLFHAADSWIRGSIVHQVSAGSSTVVIIHALESGPRRDSDESRQPLVYHNRTWHALNSHSLLE